MTMLSTPKIKRNREPRSAIWDMVRITLGCGVMALAFRLFTNGNQIVAGGVVGLSTIAQHSFGWDPALTQWAVNIPLLVIGFFALAKGEGSRSVLGSLLLPLFILATKDVPVITHNLLLASIFGGLAGGVGLGLVLSGRGSVGGYSLFGRMVSPRLPVSLATIIFALDALTICASAWVFGFERAMFGLIAAFVMRRAIDGVLVGFSQAFVALIISNQEEEIRNRVIQEMDRGLTILPGKGGFTGEDRPVMMVVLSQTEVPLLRSIVRESDPGAFVVLTPASEVVGKGFVG